MQRQQKITLGEMRSDNGPRQPAMKDRRQILAIAAASAVAALALPSAVAAEYYVPPANSAARGFNSSYGIPSGFFGTTKTVGLLSEVSARSFL